MKISEEETITDKDLAILLRDGHPALDANISRQALEQVVEEWENDPEKAEYLEMIRQSPMDVDFLSPEIKWDPDAEEHYLGPNKGPGTLNSLQPNPGFSVAGEFAQDYFNAHKNIYRELFENSNLTKKQFFAYVMKEANQNEHVIADRLGMERGTVRSHAGRARTKVEEATYTAKIAELFTFEGYEKLQQNMAELLEPQG